MNHFEIEIFKRQNFYLIKLKGNLEFSYCEILEKRILDIIYKGAINLIIDLNDLTYINSFAIGKLKKIKKEAESMGGTIILCGSNFKKFKPFFRVYSSSKEAIEFLIQEIL